MSTSTPSKTLGTALLATQTLQSNSVVVGGAVGTTTAFAAQINVNAGRYTTLVSGNAPVFQIQALHGAGADWVPIYTWTTANHIYAPLAQTVQSNAAAGATSVQLSLALASALSTPVLVYDQSNGAHSEWNWQQMASTQPTLMQSLQTGHTGGVGGAILVSHAEQWSFPIDLTGITSIRFVANNIWNAVAQPYIVSAKMNTFDNITTT
jgi:hypothetical protein